MGKIYSRGDPEYWSWRAKTGRPKAIKTPKKLWELACDYFQWVDSQPYKRQDFIKSGPEAGKIVELESIRPYTWQGFDDYIDSRSYGLRCTKDYRLNKDGRYSEFVPVIRRIEGVMFDCKFSGAAVGAFNANLIARALGLTDKQQLTVKEEQPLFGEEEYDPDKENDDEADS